MARKKKGKAKRGDSSSEEDEAPPKKEDESGGKQMSRKEKRAQKQQQKKSSAAPSRAEEEADALAALLAGGAAVESSSEEEEEVVVQKPAPKSKKIKGGALAALRVSSSSEEDGGGQDDDDADDGSDVEQVAMVLADDDGWGDDSKEKKRLKKERKAAKKAKKEKKSKKEKKRDKADGEKDAEKDSPPPSKEKTKFELQMEAAMAKKNENAAEEEKVADVQKPSAKPAVEEEPDWVDTAAQKNNGGGEDDDEDIMYGAPDDEVWNDQSAAQRAQGEASKAVDPKAMMFGPDGKKLSNKERKRLVKAQEAAERAAAYEISAAAASKEGAQFACSQTAVNPNDPQWANALDVNIPQFSISAAGKILFKDASLVVGHGRRYGLVAANGRGKSTLLKMIASRDLQLPPRVDFLYVEQEVEADDTPAVEAVLRADKVRWDLQEEETKLLAILDDESKEPDDTLLDRLQVVTDELAAMGADAAESKARRILYGLGFSMDMQTKATRMFSGGWRMRISLARALFVEPTLLMLDEPTNHLDLNAVIWLDEYLQKWKKTLLVVSHDQDFLNSVCQEILSIEDLALCPYKGNYDSYKRAEKTKFVQRQKAWEKQEKRLRELKKSGQSRQKAAETIKNSNKKREAGARSTKKKNQAVAAGTEAAEATKLITRPKEYSVKLEFVEVNELSRPVMEVNNVHFRYSPKHPVIFDCVDFGIDMDSRICVVGPNGAGKSTLLKLLTGELDPTKGECKRNPRLRMGIYNQHFVERLPMGKTPVEHLRDRFQKEDYQSIRNRLGRYGLEGHAHEVTMRDLSGGQKARVVFVELSLQEPHILLLDEPTNNLDIETIDALCDAINEFNGGIVVVTHDQRLIEECECTLWVVEKRGVTRWDAGFDDYKETILKELEEAVAKEAAERQKKLAASAQAKAEKIAKLAKVVKKKNKK